MWCRRGWTRRRTSKSSHHDDRREPSPSEPGAVAMERCYDAMVHNAHSILALGRFQNQEWGRGGGGGGGGGGLKSKKRILDNIFFSNLDALRGHLLDPLLDPRDTPGSAPGIVTSLHRHRVFEHRICNIAPSPSRLTQYDAVLLRYHISHLLVTFHYYV